MSIADVQPSMAGMEVSGHAGGGSNDLGGVGHPSALRRAPGRVAFGAAALGLTNPPTSWNNIRADSLHRAFTSLHHAF